MSVSAKTENAFAFSARQIKPIVITEISAIVVSAIRKSWLTVRIKSQKTTSKTSVKTELQLERIHLCYMTHTLKLKFDRAPYIGKLVRGWGCKMTELNENQTGNRTFLHAFYWWVIVTVKPRQWHMGSGSVTRQLSSFQEFNWFQGCRLVKVKVLNSWTSLICCSCTLEALMKVWKV